MITLAITVRCCATPATRPSGAVRADTAQMSGSAAAALAELENFGAYGKAPAPAEEEAPPPKRQRAPARSSASLLAEAEAELASSQVE